MTYWGHLTPPLGVLCAVSCPHTHCLQLWGQMGPLVRSRSSPICLCMGPLGALMVSEYGTRQTITTIITNTRSFVIVVPFLCLDKDLSHYFHIDRDIWNGIPIESPSPCVVFV